jgi:hypothetical protein
MLVLVAGAGHRPTKSLAIYIICSSVKAEGPAHKKDSTFFINLGNDWHLPEKLEMNVYMPLERFELFQFLVK